MKGKAKVCTTIAVIVASVLVLSACRSTEPGRQQAVLDGVQGERVSSVCFLRDIRNWYALDERSVIIQRGRDDYYKLDLIGACDTRQAFLTLRTQSRSGICLSPGDEISFPRDQGFSCSISNIHAWHPREIED